MIYTPITLLYSIKAILIIIFLSKFLDYPTKKKVLQSQRIVFKSFNILPQKLS